MSGRRTGPDVSGIPVLLRRLAAVAVVCALPGVPVATAQSDSVQRTPALRFELHNQQTVCTGAPIPLVFDLLWDGAGVTLLEGQLHLVLTDGVDRYGEYVSPDLVVSPGRTTWRVLLPSLEGRMVFQAIDLQARFLSSDGDEFDLETRPLRIQVARKRYFRILYCDPVTTTDDRRVLAFLNSLKFEQLWRTAARNDGRPVDPDSAPVTVFDSQRPTDMPHDPHWFCTTSIVVLSRNGFSELRSRQLAALRDWVRAGGSLCVELFEGLTAEHLDFLTALAGESSGTELAIGLRDGLTFPEDGRPFTSRRAGLGRVVILYASLRDSFGAATDGWNGAVADLWHFRADQRRSTVSDGRLLSLDARELYPDNRRSMSLHGQRYYAYLQQQTLDGDRTDSLTVQPIQSVQGLLERLMPRDVEVVPLSYIGAILLFYLLAIGPVDYFLLGAFKARRFTWITFPLTTVGFTLFTVWLSNSYLSSSAERTHVDVLDVTPDGDVARSSRFELLFTMSSSNVVSEVKRGIFTSLDHSRFGGTIHDQYRRAVYRHTIPAPTITGRPPGMFTAIQGVPKWTPQVNRIFRIAPDVESLPSELTAFDWQRPRDFRSSEGRRQLSAAVRAAFGRNVIAVLFNQRRSLDLVDNQPHVFEESLLPVPLLHGGTGSSGEWVYTDFLRDTSARLQGPGLFEIVNRISPHGGANFEDLTLLDPSDPDQWLLVIAQPDGENMTIYRRLYQLSPRPSGDADGTASGKTGTADPVTGAAARANPARTQNRSSDSAPDGSAPDGSAATAPDRSDHDNADRQNPVRGQP